MANAAAKKAAAAKKGASSIYLPILVGFNVIHLGVISSRGLLKSYYRLFVTLVQWIITYVAFQGILQDSEHSNLTKSRKGQLSGGWYLDILGVVMLSQLGGWIFQSYIHMMDSLLMVLPTIYGLYKWISQKMMGSNHQGHDGTSPQDTEAMKALEERRRQRAERRRQKRM